MFVFDTDHVSLMERANSKEGRSIHARIAETGEVPAITIITYEEATRGWLGYTAKARTVTDHVRAYRKLARHLELHCRLRILECNELAATEYQNLHRLHPTLGVMDKRIAAIVLVHG